MFAKSMIQKRGRTQAGSMTNGFQINLSTAQHCNDLWGKLEPTSIKSFCGAVEHQKLFTR